jgi:hypothetical protein
MILKGIITKTRIANSLGMNVKRIVLNEQTACKMLNEIDMILKDGRQKFSLLKLDFHIDNSVKNNVIKFKLESKFLNN